MSLYDMAKDAAKLAQKADNSELFQKLLEVQQQALEMQEKLQKKNEEIEKLKTENEILSSALTTQDDYVLGKSVWWRADDQAHEQPYCPTCKANGKILPMQKDWTKFSGHESPWTCSDKKCNTHANPWNASMRAHKPTR
jgi:hypothetical protein